MKRRLPFGFFLILFFCLSYNRGQATGYTSNATGNWNTSTIWTPNGIPGTGDNVTIHGGTTVTVNGSNQCASVTIGDATAGATGITIGGSDTLAVSGNVIINQPSTAVTNSLAVNTGVCNIAGTLTFSGANTTAGRISKVAVTTGSLTVTGTVSYAANTTQADQVTTLTSTGSITFGSSLALTYGTLSTTSTGTLNFNGSAPSFALGGTGTPTFTTTNGGTINFASGFTNNSVAYTFAATSTEIFTGSGSITPNAAVTFGNIQLNSGTTTLAGNINVAGNWTNNGATLSGGSNTVYLLGNGKTIGGTAATAFPGIQVGTGASAVAYTMNNTNSCTGITFYAGGSANTFTLADSLTVNGNVIINQPVAAVTNSLVINGSICTINGNLTFTGTSATANEITKVSVSSGLLTITGNVNYAADATAANQVITLTSTGNIKFSSSLNMAYGTLSTTSTGTLNFNGSSPSLTFGSSSSPVFTTTNAGTINFAHGFINNTNAFTFAATSNAVFTGSGTITANANVTFGNLQMNGSDTLASAGSVVDVAGNYILSSGATFDALQNFELTGNWTNNGGTMMGSSDTIVLIGAAKTIGGTTATTFPVMQVGNSATAGVSYTMNNSNSCNAMIFYATAKANTYTLGGATDTLRITGDLTINQPTGAVTNNLLINTGVGNVTGNVNLPGTVTTANYIAKITVTSGSFTVGANVNWGSNTVPANEVITVSTGNITFNGSITMASGTLSVTSTGTINFNSGSSPSFNFGGANAPVFTTTNGCSVKLKNGITNNANALTFTATSNTYFTGSGSITPNATITFGNVQLDSLFYDTLNSGAGTGIVAGSFTMQYGSNIMANQALEIRGAWVNNGGTISSASNPVIMNGVGQTIGGSSTTVFPILQMGGTSVANTVTCTINTNITCDSLVFNPFTKSRTLTVSSGVTLTVSGNVNINQPTAAGNNILAVGAGTCNVSGNLNFTGISNTANFIGEVSVTSGNFSLSGNVNWMSNTAVTTELITVSTGTINFAQSLAMGTGTGTLSVTGTGTVNFNGTTEPSFNFGGAATSPSFTTTAGCILNFADGFTNNSVALTIKAGSYAYFTGSASITPNAAITFGNVQINSSINDTLNSGGAVIITGNFTLASGSLFYAKENFEVDGNWTNTSATLSGTVFTVFLNGASQTVSGSSTTFQTLEIGNNTSAVNVAANMTCNNTCSALIFEAGPQNRNLTLTKVLLTVTGNLTLNQPTANSMTNLLEVGQGSCNVGGNLVFSGANASVTRISQIDVTSGAFNLTGSVTWGGSTATGVNIISLNSGTVNFGTSVAMATKSGTLEVTGAGIMSFNGTTAPSLNFGGAVAPVFTTTSGCTVNFNKGLTAVTTPLAFASGSNAVFTGTSTLTPTAAISFGNIQISPGKTLTLAGSISLSGNWTDSGTLVPSTNAVTFNGSGTQTIFSNSGTETFYQLSTSAAGAIVQLLNNVMITNALTMGGANINMNGYTLTLGNNAGANLNYVGGIAYGGTWQRWLPATAISSSSGAYYGLFPIGTSTDYRYVNINSTANPTFGGYISATHTDVTGGIVVHYYDIDTSLIEEIGKMHTDLTNSGLTGGTYTIAVHFTGFSTAGNIADMKLETYTANTMGSCGGFVVPTGSTSAPTVGRTAITASNLSNRWVVGTDDEAATPLYAFYISRKTGSWNDTTSGNGTWALSSDTTHSSCGCIPISGSYVIIDSATTVTAVTSDSVDFMVIENGGNFINSSSCAFVALGDMMVHGTGTFTNNGTFVIDGDLDLPSAPVSSSNNITVVYDFILPSGGSYTQSGGTLTVNGNLIDTGTLTLSSGGAINLTGSGATISGTGSIYDSLGTITIGNNKTITPGSSFTIGTASANTTVNIVAGATLSNAGTVTLNGSVTGAAASSTWVNNANSVLNITGALLATGTLDASIGPNTVGYNGSGAQTVTAPATSYYNLSVSNTGTKSLAAPVQTTNAVSISGAAILDENSNALTGAASLNMAGTAQLKLQRSVEGVYPELTGIYSLTGGTVVLNQTGDSAMLYPATYNNLTINGTALYDISGISNISNNFYMQNSASLNNNNLLTIGGTFTDSSSAATSLYENITANGVALLAGILSDSGNNITINGSGGWNLSGGSFTATGQTIFYSATGITQNIGGSSPTSFYNLVINNPGSNVQLNVSPAATTQVTGYLNLIKGNLVTNSSNILLLQDTATVINGSASSYVSGPMIKQGNTNFIFPIGKSGIYGQVGISGMQTATTQVTAEYFPAPYGTLTPLGANLSQVSSKEYWMVERAVTSDSLQVQLFWTNALRSNVINCPYLTIAHYMGGQWINQGATSIGGSICAGAGTGSIQTNGYVSSFSPFTFGSDSGGEALPVTLVSFNATPNKNVVLTKWETQSQINNAYFTVERSDNGEIFSAIGTVKGAGTSLSALSYEFTDQNPLTGVSYYRLRQTDDNGNSTLSSVVPVAFVMQSSFTIYPNPATDHAFINVVNPSEQVIINIHDMLGRQVYAKTYPAEPDSPNQRISLPIAGNLPSGVYMVTIYTNQNELNGKLVVK